MSQIPEVQALKLLGVGTQTKAERNHENREAILDAVFTPLSREPVVQDRTGEIQWSERVRALLLAQPLNPIRVLEFEPL